MGQRRIYCMSENKIKICSLCGRKEPELKDFSEAEIVLFRRFEEWKKIQVKTK